MSKHRYTFNKTCGKKLERVKLDIVKSVIFGDRKQVIKGMFTNVLGAQPNLNGHIIHLKMIHKSQKQTNFLFKSVNKALIHILAHK